MEMATNKFRQMCRRNRALLDALNDHEPGELEPEN